MNTNLIKIMESHFSITIKKNIKYRIYLGKAQPLDYRVIVVRICSSEFDISIMSQIKN